MSLKEKMKTLDDDIQLENIEQDNYSNINIRELLVGEKKVVAFTGASKSGTSFIVNNVAKLLSSRGVSVAILDATKNNSAYYIYTKNEESLRKIAYKSIENLAHGEAIGIKVDDKLTVYTSLPGNNEYIKKVEPVLETLIKNYSLILIDCDFETPINYFNYAQEIYLIQSMDVLTVQPLTEALSELKNKGILKESKIRIIINKYVELRSITEKEIIGGMAFYNNPTMSYMKQLFDKNSVNYMKIPFEREIYERYLNQLVDCDINLDEYYGEFMQKLKELGSNIYPSN